MKIAFYSSSLTEAQWAFLEPMLSKPNKLGRPRTPLRVIIDAVFYIVKGGIPWRLLPHNFPPWKTVYHIFSKWVGNNTWEAIHARLRAHVREAAGRSCNPTAAILDSQSVKSSAHGGEVGYDAAKKIKGRKRHLLVDTLGLILGIHVTPAKVPEREGAQALLVTTLAWFGRLRRLWVDGGYSGDSFSKWVKEHRPNLVTEVVKRSDSPGRFKVLHRRWVVERTFAWLMQYRRLVRDYETKPANAENWIYIAMIRVQLRRLA